MIRVGNIKMQEIIQGEYVLSFEDARHSLIMAAKQQIIKVQLGIRTKKVNQQ